MRDLLHRRDGPGLLRLTTQLLLLAGTGSATILLATAGHPASFVTTLACGLMLPGFFAVMHEAAHRTVSTEYSFENIWFVSTTISYYFFLTKSFCSNLC